MKWSVFRCVCVFSSTDMEEHTCDDVILRQRLCLFLLPLALHYAQLSPSGKEAVGYK